MARSMTTTIKLHRETKLQLDRLREYRNESYDEVIHKMVAIVSNLSKKPELSRDAVLQIEKARERIRKGHFVTEEDAKRRLGL